jgi:hypothetical protein
MFANNDGNVLSPFSLSSFLFRCPVRVQGGAISRDERAAHEVDGSRNPPEHPRVHGLAQCELVRGPCCTILRSWSREEGELFVCNVRERASAIMLQKYGEVQL